MPAARGAGRGRAWEDLGGAGAAGGPGTGSRLPAPGPAPVTLRRPCSPSRPAPAAHGPVSQAARPPRRLLRPQLRGRLLHLHRLDGGLQPAVDGGYGGTRRYRGAQGGVGAGLWARGGALLPRLLAGGTSGGGEQMGCLPKTSFSSAGLSRPQAFCEPCRYPGCPRPAAGGGTSQPGRPALPPGFARDPSARALPMTASSLRPASLAARFTGPSLGQV